MKITLLRTQEQHAACEELKVSRGKSVLYKAPLGGGKSYLLRSIALEYAVALSDTRILLCVPSLNHVVMHFREFEHFATSSLEEDIFSIIKEQQLLKFRNGSVIRIAACSNTEDVLKLESLYAHVLLVDNIRYFDSATLSKILQLRCRGHVDIPEEYTDATPAIVLTN